MNIIADLGPGGIFTLLVLSLFFFGKSPRNRKNIKKYFSRIYFEARARRLGISRSLFMKLQRENWDRIMLARRLPGLGRGRIRRTPIGISVGLKFGGVLTHKIVSARLEQIETGLGLVSGSARLKPSRHSHRSTLHVVVRDPLARPVMWQPTPGCRLRDPLRLSMSPYGEYVTVDLRNRIGVFGTSGSGKSGVQRIIGAHVIQSIDADLEIWDLKQGLESQHFAGKATRITDSPSAIARTNWLLDEEFPRRASVMKAQGTSIWSESADNPARVIIIDEGNVLTREFSTKQLKRFFTAVEQGRALGVYFVWATQYPKHTNLPTELRSQLNVLICLLLLSSEESELVFKDGTKTGWQPHKLAGPQWMLIKSNKHTAPDESKTLFLSEDMFRTVQLSGPGPVDTSPPRPDGPSGVPDNLKEFVLDGPVSLDKTGTVRITPEDKILAVLNSSDSSVGVRDIARTTGMSPSSVSRYLGSLVRAGKIAQDPDRKYRGVAQAS